MGEGNAQVDSGLKIYTGFLKTNGSLAVLLRPEYLLPIPDNNSVTLKCNSFGDY